MSLIYYEHSALRIEVKYLQRRKNTWYFRRRIPDHAKKLHPGKSGTIFFSLKTSDKTKAARLAIEEALKLDALWKSTLDDKAMYGPEERKAAEAYLQGFGLKPGGHIAYAEADLEPDRFLDELIYLSQDEAEPPSILPARLPRHVKLAADLFYGAKAVPYLSEALELHRRLTGSKDSSKSEQGRQRAIDQLFSIAGDIPADQYTRSNANEFVANLSRQGLKSGTIKRYINYVSPVFTTAIAEYELNKTNIFHNIKIPALGRDVTPREPFNSEELFQLQRECLDQDDSLRWLIALISDTGMRVAEAACIKNCDIQLEAETPFVWIRENEIRPLKTSGSNRQIPLIGAALWSARRILGSSSDGFIFPQYASEGKNKSTHASNAANKWIRSRGFDKTLHSLRHTFRDRLRNVNAPSEVADRLGGWATKGVGQSYGQGHSLVVLKGWIEMIADPILFGVEETGEP